MSAETTGLSGDRAPRSSVEALIDRLYLPFVALLILCLVFLGGAYVVLSRTFPYTFLNDAYRGAQALIAQRTLYGSPFDTDLWGRPHDPSQRGVVVYDAERTQPGLTLYTSAHDQRAFLIDLDGAVVHEWALPLSRIWDSEQAGRDTRPDEFIFWEDVELFPNGDLLVVAIGLGDTPWGQALFKIDRESNLLWSYFDRAHHDVEVAPDGRLYTLTHEFGSDPLPGWDHLESPRIDDFVVELSPEGEELRRVSVIHALVDSPYGRLLTRVERNPVNDYTHGNTVKYVTPAMAERLPFAEAGQVIVSLRELDTLAVIDLERETVVWALRGFWYAQHDPNVLPDGSILLFDNLGHFGPGGASRLIAFDPVTNTVVWTYAGDEAQPFESWIRSGQQRLANGNTLISESDMGRLFEVTPEGAIVWSFVNPVRGGPDDAQVPIVNRAERIDPATLDPAMTASGAGGSGPEAG